MSDKKFFTILILQIIILILILFYRCDKAYSFPEMVTHGYQCSSCHVSPSGGGVLNKYGRGQSENLMAMFANEGEGDFAYVGTPDWLLLGGDIRWLNVSKKSQNLDTSRIFFMQVENEFALSPIKGLTIVGTIGKYNEGDKYEYRRNYLLLDVNEYVHFRIGHFIPDYGILLPDHTVFIHPGQGSEQYVAEASLSHPWGSLSLSRTYGHDRYLHLSGKDGYQLNDDKKSEGYVAKILFTINANTYGFSYLRDSEKYNTGPFAIVAWDDFVGLFQWDVGGVDNRTYERIGYKHFRGLKPYIGHQYRRSQQDNREVQRLDIGINLIPRPHIEIEGSLQREFERDLTSDRWMILAHYWL